MNFKSAKGNKLDYETAQHAKLEKIDIELMGEYVDEGRLNEINKMLSSLTPFEKIKNQQIQIQNKSPILTRMLQRNLKQNYWKLKLPQVQ